MDIRKVLERRAFRKRLRVMPGKELSWLRSSYQSTLIGMREGDDLWEGTIPELEEEIRMIDVELATRKG